MCIGLLFRALYSRQPKTARIVAPHYGRVNMREANNVAVTTLFADAKSSPAWLDAFVALADSPNLSAYQSRKRRCSTG